MGKLNKNIERKLETIAKMHSYQHEYSSNPSLDITRATPALSKNLDSFSQKIRGVIVGAEHEVEKLKQSREILITKIK